ncbi:hypothetical protein N7E81_10345 [Reichenbachiella carrageenanivorans]|uniref:ABM domain-containing protein n=1 Tax=Reichenbachiella carrageenanivorans TaxID=2979869 RepID=A0ABY6CVL2_9BACT|nr:hypothetical protein [Reichenbachiella carrageenanivorans]UXX77769.1 hypothetical protein N7E81_10345 [Reichenbachiella carrageenanivorans]
MTDQVVELVIYKIKPNQVENYQSKIIHHFRELVKSFDGMIGYKTYCAIKEEGLFVDQVEWRDLASAEFAAEKVKEMQDDEIYAPYLSAFEEVKFFLHLKHVA